MLKFLKQNQKPLSKFMFSTGKASSHPLFIKGGTVVNAENQMKADVLIQNGKISSLHKPEDHVDLPVHTQVLYANGKYVIPGGIDPHCHLELPFMGTTAIDDFNIGTKAAIAGGTTSFMDFIIPGPEGLMAGYHDWRKRADAKVNCDYTLHCAITDWNEKISKEMEEIVAKGISSFKVFMAYKGTSFYQNDERLLQIFARCKELGCIVMVHAENGELITHNVEKLKQRGITGPEGHLYSRGGEIEAQAVHTAIAIADTLNTPLYIVHVMKKTSAKEVRRAKKKGYVVFGEALAAGLACDGKKYLQKDWDQAAGFVMSPSIDLDESTKEFEMHLLATHDLDTTATDNCTFSKAQKRMGHSCFSKIPNGVNGIEDRLSVVWNNGVETGILTPSDFVRVTSTNSAKIFNMYPRKGVIQPGSDADVVIWDQNITRVISAKTHHHAGDFNIFEGMKVKGNAETTIVNGKVLWDGKNLVDAQGYGKFIKREPYGFAFEKIAIRDKLREIKFAPIKRD